MQQAADDFAFDFAANGSAGPSGVPPLTAQPAESQSGDIHIDPRLTGSPDETAEYTAQLDRAGYGAQQRTDNLLGQSPPRNVIGAGAGADDSVESTSLATAAAAAVGSEKREPEGGSKAKGEGCSLVPQKASPLT